MTAKKTQGKKSKKKKESKKKGKKKKESEKKREEEKKKAEEKKPGKKKKKKTRKKPGKSKAKKEKKEKEKKKKKTQEETPLPRKAAKVFNQWNPQEAEVTDPGLKEYINLSPFILLHTHGRHASKQFGKNEVSIVERLINSIMRSGTQKKVGGKRITSQQGTGKKVGAYKTVRKAFNMIHQQTNQNPVQVLVRAIENSAPKEETTRVKYGGITRHIAVDISPQRRVDFALRNISIAAIAKSFDTKKSRAEALADEIIAASNQDASSLAISKKNEAERVARGAR